MDEQTLLLFDLRSILRSSALQEQYLSAREIAEVIYECRKDASLIAEQINELEKNGDNKVEPN